MKKGSLVLMVLILGFIFCLQGCGVSKLTTKIAINIGEGFLASRDIGVPGIKKVMPGWSYVSGQISRIPHQDENISPLAKKALDNMDKLAKKTELTDADCGAATVDLIIIEKEAIKFGWDKYGVTITEYIKTLVAG